MIVVGFAVYRPRTGPGRTAPTVILTPTGYIILLTQNGQWEGWIKHQGERINVAPVRWFGTRDRSWGIRPIGERDAQATLRRTVSVVLITGAPINWVTQSRSTT